MMAGASRHSAKRLARQLGQIANELKAAVKEFFRRQRQRANQRPKSANAAISQTPPLSKPARKPPPRQRT